MRRSQEVERKLFAAFQTTNAKEEYAEYLIEWENRASILLDAGVVKQLDDLSGFTVEQLREIESEEDVHDIQTEQHHEGVHRWKCM